MIVLRGAYSIPEGCLFLSWSNVKNDIFAKTFEDEFFCLKEFCSHMDITIEKLRKWPCTCCIISM